jgi:hypothetical protein
MSTVIDEYPEREPSVADLFRRMAKRIDHNAADGFGGAFLIVPPPNGGEAIDTLILDAMQDPAQFWLLLKTKCDLQIQKIDNAQRQATFRR